jgi:hypothetical protein
MYMGDIMEQEDSQLEERIASRRHKEMLNEIKKLQPKDDTEMKQLIRAVHSALSNFKTNVSVESPEINIPQSSVNVNVDNKEITEVVRNLVERIETSNDEKVKSHDKLIEKLDEWIEESKRPKQFTMSVKRNDLLPHKPIESVSGEIK